MRILMLAHRLPYPPRTGDKVRAYHVARHLAGGHALTLACLSDEPEAATAAATLGAEVGRLVWVPIDRRAQRLRAFGTLLGGGSATLAYFASSELQTRVGILLREAPPDLIYVSSSSMTQYLPAGDGRPVVMDFVDVDSDKWRQYGARLPLHKAWVYRLEAKRLRAAELAAARRASRCIVATPQEETLLHSFAPWAPTSVVPNGVDLEYFTPPPTPSAEPVIVFAGAMDYFPNVDAATFFTRRVFPRVRREVPGARFVVVGKSPASVVRRLASLRDVEVTGTVPDVRPLLRRAAVAVAPLRVARGVQNKILEAMAMGLPVVATGKAHEGLAARAGEHLVVEDEAAGFGDAVVRLLRAPGERAALGRAGRRYVEAHHSWEAAMARLEAVLQALARRGAPPVPQAVS